MSVKMCFIGGPLSGRVEETYSEPCVGDAFIGAYTPLTDSLVSPTEFVPGGREFHHYVCQRLDRPFAMYHYVCQVSDKRVAEMMPRSYDWDPRRGLVYKVPLEDRPT